MILRAIVRIDDAQPAREVAAVFVEAAQALGLCVEREDVGDDAEQWALSIHSEDA